jgi:hypothetical protein
MNNVYDLLREKPNEKEIIKAKIESVDPFGRALCSTPNGTFRAIGVVKKGSQQKEAIVANSGQRQTEFHVLQYWGRNKPK